MTAIASGMITGPRVAAGSALHFQTWSEAWTTLYFQQRMMMVDPLPRWALVSGTPARWSEILQRLPAQDPGRQVGARAVSFGYAEGVVVPIRNRHGQLGLVTMGGPARELDALSFTYLCAIAPSIHQRADALDQTPSPIPRELSRRERECVTLLIQGLTEREMAAHLHISEVTARFHLDNARRKTGARSRTHLAGIAGLWLSHANGGDAKSLIQSSDRAKTSRSNSIM
ncbi:MAG: LuxR family transcriptional regulator [Acidocella sp.]|nr:LuxR family transcriptional regulator [Acidocella sp.]